MARILSKYRNDANMQRGGVGQGIGPTQGAMPQAPASQAPVQSSSGNFTNVTNYLKANQQAGERIGSRIGQGISGALSQSQSESEKQFGKLGTDLTQAGSTLQRGEGYQQELGQEGFDAQKFLQGTVPGTTGLVAGQQSGQQTQQAPTKLEDFSKFRTGTAVDAGALEKQRGEALGSAITAQQNVGQQQNLLGSEAGRFGLLKSYLGGKDYRQGLQSLDQTFLQQQGQKSLADTQQSLQERNKALVGTQTNLDTEQVKNIQAAVDRQKMLSEGLTKKTGEMETKYISDLDAQVAAANEKRAAEAKRYQDFANRMTQGPTSEFEFREKTDDELRKEISAPYDNLFLDALYSLDPEKRASIAPILADFEKKIPTLMAEARQKNQAERDAAKSAYETAQAALPQLDLDLLRESGLRLGQQTFNVLNPNLQAEDFIDFDKRVATRGQDIATQKNVDYYKALSDLAGMSNAKLANRGFLVGEDDKLAAGAAMAKGERSLGGRANLAADALLKEALGTNFLGSKTETYGKRGFSSGSSTTQNAQINAASALTGLPPEYIGRLFDQMSESATQQSAIQDVAGNYFTGGTYGLIKGGGDALTGGALSDIQNQYNKAMQDTLTNVGSSLGLWGSDGPQEAVRAARMHATAQAQSQFQDWLRSKGFGNYMTERGVKTAVGPLSGEKFGYGRDKFSGSPTGGAGKEQVRAVPRQQVGINRDYVPQQLINLPNLTEEDV